MESKGSKAFTLIELSIVLVIIGLIVGGVLTGRDLINASRIRKMGTELQQMSVAINTFRLRYDCLPGDCANATTYFGVNSSPCPNGGGATGTCDGDGDGYIGTSHLFPREHLYAWQQLSMAKLIPFTFPGSAITGGFTNIPIIVGQNVPSSVLNPAIGYNFYSVRKGSGRAETKTIEIGAVGNPNADVLSGAGLNGPQAQSLDLKFDDGKAEAGKIYAVSGGSSISPLNTVQTQASSVNSNTTCVASGAYLTSNSSGCTMQYTPDVP